MRLRQRQPDDQDVLRFKAGVDRLQTEKAFDEQARADQQHRRERDFRDDQQTPRPTLPRPACSAAPALFELIVEVQARRLPGRGQTEEHSGQERKREREAQHAEVHADFDGARQARGTERKQQVNSESLLRATQAGEQQAFGRKLLDQTPAGGAQRGADGHLSVPRHSPRQSQVRQIDAGHQQHHADRCKQHP